MKSSLSQVDIEVYASDEDAVKEKPDNGHYSDGVSVGYTAPAKWWNWLVNKITNGLSGIKADKASMQTEMLNVLSSAGVTPSDGDSHQLSSAIDKVAYGKTREYDEEEITEEIDGQMVTHKENQPFVVGHTLYIPDTELL